MLLATKTPSPAGARAQHRRIDASTGGQGAQIGDANLEDLVLEYARPRSYDPALNDQAGHFGVG